MTSSALRPISAGSDIDEVSAPARRADAGLVAVAALIGSVAALVAARPLRDNSVLTHLATGRILIRSGVPDANPFLYTGTDFPVPSWWWSLLLGMADHVGGATAIRLLSAATAAILGVVLVRLTGGDLGRPNRELLPTVVPPGLALLCVFAYLNPRPHLAGFVLLGVALLLVGSRHHAGWLVVLFAVWVNVHGSWVYGVAVVALFCAARAADDRRIVGRTVTLPSAALGGVLLGGVLYPRTWELVVLPTRQFGDPVEREALSTYAEWSPLPITEPALWALLVLVALAARGTYRSRRWAHLALVVLLAAMGLSGARMVPIAAISLVGLAAQGLQGLGSLRLPTGTSAARLVGLAAVLGALVPVYVVATPGYALAPYPEAAVDWLEQRGLVANGTNVVSHDYVGNYLAWRYGTDAHAYVDDRPDAGTLIDYVALMRMTPGWSDALERARPDVVLWRSDRELVDALEADGEWVRAVELDGHTVFCSAALAGRCS